MSVKPQKMQDEARKARKYRQPTRIMLSGRYSMFREKVHSRKESQQFGRDSCVVPDHTHFVVLVAKEQEEKERYVRESALRYGDTKK